MNTTQGPTFSGWIHAELLRWRARRPHNQHHLRTTHLESGDASTAGVAAPKPKSPSSGAPVLQIETLQFISQPAAPLGAAALNSYAQIALLNPQFTHGDIAKTYPFPTACGAPGSSRAELIRADRVTQPTIHPWRHRRDHFTTACGAPGSSRIELIRADRVTQPTIHLWRHRRDPFPTACGAPGSSRAELIRADRVTQPTIHPWRHRQDLPLSYSLRRP